MRTAICLLVIAGICSSLGCHKEPDTPLAGAAPAVAAKSQGQPASGGMTVVSPDVGPVTPVTNSALDDAAGGGVNSAALKKAKGIAAGGVGSVNSAQKQGYGADDGN